MQFSEENGEVALDKPFMKGAWSRHGLLRNLSCCTELEFAV